MSQPDDNPFDLSALHEPDCASPNQVELAKLAEREQERLYSAALSDTAFTLSQRFGWNRARVLNFLDYELRERLVDCSEADAKFRAWYEEFRKDHPPEEL